MMQNWTSIVESNWIFSKFYLLIYIYIYINNFCAKWNFFSYKKKAHKYKIIQTLSSSNFIYNRYMIMFFYDLFILDSSFSILN